MTEPETAEEALIWLGYAHEDLEIAGEMASNPKRARHACWYAQQASEKALKALLLLEGIDFPFTHDLEKLLPYREAWPEGVMGADLEHLTQRGAQSRYPGDHSPPTAKGAAHAYSEARAVYESIVGEFARRGVNVEQA